MHTGVVYDSPEDLTAINRDDPAKLYRLFRNALDHLSEYGYLLETDLQLPVFDAPPACLQTVSGCRARPKPTTASTSLASWVLQRSTIADHLLLTATGC